MHTDYTKLELNPASFFLRATGLPKEGFITLELPKARPKLLVLGHGRHGKDTFCEILRDDYGFTFNPSSLLIAGYIKDNWLQDQNYASDVECFEDRVNHRKTWFNAIASFNKDDPTAHAKNVLKNEGDIYCGVRRLHEFEACIEEKLFDYVIWVDAIDRLPPEHPESFNITMDRADYVVDNNGTLEQFHQNIAFLMEKLLD